MECENVLLTRIIQAVGSETFAAEAAEALRAFTDFDLTAVVLHRPAKSPTLLFDNFDACGCRPGLENYVRATHRINPILSSRRPAGAFRARDFKIDPKRFDRGLDDYWVTAPDEELGFRTRGWPERCEEIALHFQGWDGMVEFGLYRERHRFPASRDLMRSLQGLSAPISAAFDRHRLLVRPLKAASRAEGALPHPSLTARENEICKLLLAGYSSEAIALRLFIGRHTVKDHRKAIFRKLGVGTLAQLFAKLQ